MKKFTSLLTAVLFTTGMVFAQNNSATVNQSGDDHETTITQSFNDNSSMVTQSGTDGGNLSEVEQDGNDQVILTQSSELSGASIAYIAQEGGSSDNKTWLNQEGNNYAEINQNDGSGTVYGYDGMQTTADQVNSGGGLNSLTVEQSGFAMRLFIDQLAGGNTANIVQGVGFNHVAKVLQESKSNMAKVEQYRNGWLTAGHKLDLLQSGLGSNEAILYQVGDGHQMTVEQLVGEFNTANITQYGTENTANVTQSGSYNTATITQNN